MRCESCIKKHGHSRSLTHIHTCAVCGKDLDAASPGTQQSEVPCEAPCSTPDFFRTDEEVLEWATEKYGYSLPQRVADLRAIIADVVAESRLKRGA